MAGVFTGWLGAGAWLVAMPSASLALSVPSQFYCIAREKGLTFTFLGCEGFSLFGLFRVTMLYFLATLGPVWKDLLAKSWQ